APGSRTPQDAVRAKTRRFLAISHSAPPEASYDAPGSLPTPSPLGMTFFPFFPAAPQTFLAICRYILVVTYRLARDPIHEPAAQLAPLPTARGPATAPAAPGRVPRKRTAPPRLALHPAAKVRQTKLPLQPR